MVATCGGEFDCASLMDGRLGRTLGLFLVGDAHSTRLIGRFTNGALCSLNDCFIQGFLILPVSS